MLEDSRSEKVPAGKAGYAMSIDACFDSSSQDGRIIIVMSRPFMVFRTGPAMTIARCLAEWSWAQQ